MDINKVINLGHKLEQPLMCSLSELVDGLEPHDHICTADHATARTGSHARDGRGVPGVGAWVGAWEGVYRVLTHPPSRWPD